MSRRFWIVTVAAMALIAGALTGGCAATGARDRQRSALDLQQKVHQEQLTRASQQDAASAEGSSRESLTEPTREHRRRDGQRVIDQPIRH